VNIAARLQSIAKPGAVCISGHRSARQLPTTRSVRVSS
jgi:class 3 adenylate cyclase